MQEWQCVSNEVIEVINNMQSSTDTAGEAAGSAVAPAPTVTASDTLLAPSAAFETLLNQLEGLIHYRFTNRALLQRALTHRSFANEQPDPRPAHNEALEFLGDAVLEFLISAWLLELYPTQNEGTLSKLRAYAVSAVNLQKHGIKLGLGNYLLLNRGEEKTGGRSKMALQVDAYEALIAAIYLDGGIEMAKEFVRREFAHTFKVIDPQNLAMADYKTALQEKLQSAGLPTPNYAIVESLGPDHHRIFQIELRVAGTCIARGQGTTIKGAHQAAAAAAVASLDNQLERLRAAYALQTAAEAEPKAETTFVTQELEPLTFGEPVAESAEPLST